MAGHSKWANIKHQKAKQDAKRGKIFTKLIREITIAAKIGGGDANANPRLRAAIDAGFSANMTKDTIERAIKRGAGGMEDQDVVEITYEGYGVRGVAVIVECMTDNRNRTVSTVRHAFSKCGGNLGTDGSVAYLFKKQGLMVYGPGSDEDKIIEAALEAGVEDIVTNDDGSIDVLTPWENFMSIKESMVKAGLTPINAEITMLPSMYVTLEKDDAEKVMRLVDMLEELDDVQNVYTNADISEEVLTEMNT